LPVLGPVYSTGKPIKKILFDVLNNAETDTFLDYDKNKRWHKAPQEQIITNEIKYNADWLCIPTLSATTRHLKLYFYSKKRLDEQILTQITAAYTNYQQTNQIKHCSLLFFIAPTLQNISARYNIYLKTISEKDRLNRLPDEIYFYNQLPEGSKSTFELLGKEPDMDGFAFLSEQIRANNALTQKIICLVRDSGVIGAIGPLDIIKDSWNTKWLLPSYFGVKEKFRGKDCGARLWQAAISYAFAAGARYTLVQNAPDSAAAQFYEGQGLTNAGQIYVINLDCG
jgi:GNAT superfamily N-acetyltransferase